MALCRQVVDFIGGDLFEQAVEVGRVGHIAIVKEQPLVHQLLVLNVQVVDPSTVEGTAPADYAVHFVPLVQKEFRKV